MFRPEAHADPAELILAFPASHVIATPILFDRRRAFGAFFGVCVDPIGRLRIILALLDPHLDKGAGRRLMVVERAAKTKAMFACTADCRNDFVQLLPLDDAVDCILAIWRRTPLEMLFIVNVGSSEENLVPGQEHQCHIEYHFDVLTYS